MRSVCILLMMTIAVHIGSANEEFEMDMAKIYRVRMDVDDLKGGL